MRILIAAAAALAGLGAVAQAAGRGPSPPDPAAAHGAQLAQGCAACHAVGADDRGRNPGAPPFRTLALRYSPPGLDAALRRIARYGHHGMRPRQIGDADAGDLAAYIASLKTPSRR